MSYYISVEDLKKKIKREFTPGLIFRHCDIRIHKESASMGSLYSIYDEKNDKVISVDHPVDVALKELRDYLVRL